MAQGHLDGGAGLGREQVGSGQPGPPSKQSFALLLQLLFVFPNIMRWVPGPHQRIYTNYLKLAKFVGERLEMNRQTLDPNSPRDFIDCFLIKIQQVSTSGPALWPLPGPADGGRGFLPDSHSQDPLEEATTVAASSPGSRTRAVQPRWLCLGLRDSSSVAGEPG